jgi:hypothetical protein
LSNLALSPFLPDIAPPYQALPVLILSPIVLRKNCQRKVDAVMCLRQPLIQRNLSAPGQPVLVAHNAMLSHVSSDAFDFCPMCLPRNSHRATRRALAQGPPIKMPAGI